MDSIILFFLVMFTIGVVSWTGILISMVGLMWLVVKVIRRVDRALDAWYPVIPPGPRRQTAGASKSLTSLGLGYEDWASRVSAETSSSNDFVSWYVQHQVWDPLGLAQGDIADSYLNYSIWADRKD